MVMFMPSNAFSSLVIDGLIKVNDTNVPLTCLRGISIPGKVLNISSEYCGRVGGPPVRPPSKLPQPGNLCLHVSIDPDRLGYGRVGSVYPISIDNDNQYSLPPLVIKVAARQRSENLAREAWFYEEMEHIQGAVIAWCYGLFMAEIDSNGEVLGWAEADAKYNPDEIDYSLEEDEDNLSPDTRDTATSSNEVYRDITELSSNMGRDDKEDSISLPPALKGDGRTFVSVLVLERLGGLMPMNVSLEPIRSDIYDIYNDMGQFGVEQADVRWRNILEAPTTHEGVVCPYHGRKHQWRVIDFDRARKSGFRQETIDIANISYLSRLIDSLPEGDAPEPWD